MLWWEIMTRFLHLVRDSQTIAVVMAGPVVVGCCWTVAYKFTCLVPW